MNELGDACWGDVDLLVNHGMRHPIDAAERMIEQPDTTKSPAPPLRSPTSSSAFSIGSALISLESILVRFVYYDRGEGCAAFDVDEPFVGGIQHELGTPYQCNS